MPGRVAEGVVEARRILVIEDGQLMRILGDGLALVRRRMARGAPAARRCRRAARGRRRGEDLGTGVGQRDQRAFADITALLDTEQFEAVHAPADQPLALGSAGSGKDHGSRCTGCRESRPRLRRDVHPLSRTRVSSSGRGARAARLSRRLLAPLGASGRRCRRHDWATSLARQVFGVVSCPRSGSTRRGSSSRSSDTRRCIARCGAGDGRADRARGGDAGRGAAAAAKRLAAAALLLPFLGAVVDDAGGTLPSYSAIEETVRHTMDQIADTVERQIARVVVREKKRAVDGRSIAEGTPRRRRAPSTSRNLPLLLFAASLAQGGDALGALDADPIAHPAVDEAEDVSLFELLRAVEAAPRAAQRDAGRRRGAADVVLLRGRKTSLGALSASDAAVCRLAVSYRCPRPIAAFAGPSSGTSRTRRRRRRATGRRVETFAFPATRRSCSSSTRSWTSPARRAPRSRLSRGTQTPPARCTRCRRHRRQRRLSWAATSRSIWASTRTSTR